MPPLPANGLPETYGCTLLSLAQRIGLDLA